MIKKTDHRDLAERFEWYFKNEKIQGLPIFLEDWVFIRRRIEELICCEWEKWGFKEVMTPIIADKEMYERSGHLEQYKNLMFQEIEKKNKIYY